MIDNRGLFSVILSHYVNAIWAANNKPPVLWQILMDGIVYTVSAATTILLLWLYHRYIDKR